MLKILNGKMNEIKRVVNPKIIIIPMNGDASRFEIKTVKDNVLKWYIIIGIIIMFALIVMPKISAIFIIILFFFIFVICFSRLLYISTIPIVPPKESCKPTSKI